MHYIPKSSPKSKLESESSPADSSKNWRTSRFLRFLPPVLSSSPAFPFPAVVFPATPLPLPFCIWRDELKEERERESVREWLVSGDTLDRKFIRGILCEFTVLSLLSWFVIFFVLSFVFFFHIWGITVLYLLLLVKLHFKSYISILWF